MPACCKVGTPEACDACKKSTQYQEQLENLGAQSTTALSHEHRLFQKEVPDAGFRPNTDILNAWWPASISLGTQEVVSKAERPIHTRVSSIPNPSWLRWPPAF
ncbi:hypothetical protein B0J13DRAFT_541322 [Dactylonectria estremocensis]|uniref:Uncharacterized protein n=1 Tax=Dactylonectria estremocensis TaxID=1079267 RepID=A0A9P9FFK5_9HYPO|nr:hypothetical protein B0J13DRAFT_541322 [Dactylonectria estremocensis]